MLIHTVNPHPLKKVFNVGRTIFNRLVAPTELQQMFGSHHPASAAAEDRLEEPEPEVVGGDLGPACTVASTVVATDKQEVSTRRGKRQKTLIEPMRSDMDLVPQLTLHLPHATGEIGETDNTDKAHTNGTFAGTVGAIGAFVTPVSPSFTKNIRMVKRAWPFSSP